MSSHQGPSMAMPNPDAVEEKNTSVSNSAAIGESVTSEEAKGLTALPASLCGEVAATSTSKNSPPTMSSLAPSSARTAPSYVVNEELRRNRLLPGLAAVIMPNCCLFILTAIEGNWSQLEPGSTGQRVTKPAKYIVGNAIPLALEFISTVFIMVRTIEPMQRYVSQSTIAFLQMGINFIVGSVALAVAVVYDSDSDFSDYYTTPEFVCLYAGAVLAYLQVLFFAVDYLTTSNYNKRGSGVSLNMQAATGLAALVNIWTGFGALIFSNVEDKRLWHSFNSCFEAWNTLTATGIQNMPVRTNNSKIFVLFWLPLGYVIMFAYGTSLVYSAIEYFDAPFVRRKQNARRQLRSYLRATRIGTSKRMQPVKPDDDESGSAEHTQGVLCEVPLPEGQAINLRHLARQHRHFYYLLFWCALAAKVASWLLGSLIFHLTEDWKYWDAMYFTFMAVLGVGMPGWSPSSAAGQVLYLCYTYLDLILTFMFIAVMVHIVWNLVPWKSKFSQAGEFLLKYAPRWVRAAVGGHSGDKAHAVGVHSAEETTAGDTYDEHAQEQLSWSLNEALSAAQAVLMRLEVAGARRELPASEHKRSDEIEALSFPTSSSSPTVPFGDLYGELAHLASKLEDSIDKIDAMT